MLKPLHGDEPMLEAALEGIVTQGYPRFQVVFGVQSAADPAIAVVQRLRRRFPDRDLCLVVDPTEHGQNRKIGNLINMLPHASHDLLVISDSDIHVRPDYLLQVARSFADRGVGLVTTLYHGIPASPTLSRRFGAGQINHNFLPGVLLSRVLGRQDCLGSTMALRRDTLQAVGGLAMLSPHVADDSVLGKLVRGQGLGIAVAPCLTATTIAETGPADLFAHELRWGRTVRAVEPLGYALSSVQFPLFWSSLAVIAAPQAGWGLGAVRRDVGAARRGRRADRSADREHGRPWRQHAVAPAAGAGLAVGGDHGRQLHRPARRLARPDDARLRLVGAPGAGQVDRAAHHVARAAGAQHQTLAQGDRSVMMKTLFLQPPSFDGFDGGAGSRYQAKREIKSFWYPTWLAQPAALIPDSRLIDAPPARLGLEPVLADARDRDLVVLHTSTPSFASDVKVAQALKEAKPSLKIGMVGAKVAVQPEESLLKGAPIDFVARNEFDFTIKEVAEGRDFKDIDGISFRGPDGAIVHNRERAMIENMDSLPFVTDVYKRDLRIEDYFIGYLLHPYISIYTGRGCKSHCTFCLWPQTVGGHRYRTRSPQHVAEEIRAARKLFPQVREFFFDDDTFTDDLPRAEAIARELGRMGVVWSCNAKANVPRKTLEVLKANGLRLLLVGYETGNQQILYNIKKGMRIEVAREFTRNCHELGIKIHGTFILGLPGETRETIQETIRFATEINPHTLQVSLAAPLSRHLPAQAGDRAGLAGREERRADRRARHPDRPAELPASVPHRDLRQRRDLLPEVLFPGAEDRRHRRRDGAQPADDEATPARGRGVLPVPARAPRGLSRGGSTPGPAAARRVIVSADDFGLSTRDQRGGRAGASRGRAEHRQPDGGGAGRVRCGRPCEALASRATFTHLIWRVKPDMKEATQSIVSGKAASLRKGK